MYRSIVVGSDGSASAGEAVRQAAEMAKLCGASLHLVNAYRSGAVVQALAVSAPVPVPEDTFRIGELAAKDSQILVEKIVSDLDAAGIEVQTHCHPGDAAEAILNVATAQKADLIVVGNKGMTGAKRFLLGSVPNNVAHHAPCNVMIVYTC